ncbi:hypothetical protein AMTR_s00050p00223310 [Amborella trichopoda]|uniref:Uncharacterized protein n=1 Tax=Amborella trichopoda TaxID=13333 RepID=W1PYB8_AMBTC|nr:hypothetical protein AMTR_s00050p00223310 [Amborella trichopoda]
MVAREGIKLKFTCLKGCFVDRILWGKAKQDDPRHSLLMTEYMYRREEEEEEERTPLKAPLMVITTNRP